ERAVRALRSGRSADVEDAVDVSAEINLHVPALLPARYCSDVHERLTLYKRLANCTSEEALEAMTEELVDRFGELPEPARALLECHRLRVAARALGITRIDATHEAILLHFVKHPPLEAQRIIDFVQSTRGARFAGPDRLRLEAKLPEWQARGRAVKDALRRLAA
ncbi:MAG: transcription-repair coupling factor, partial [bacterium]